MMTLRAKMPARLILAFMVLADAAAVNAQSAATATTPTQPTYGTLVPADPVESLGRYLRVLATMPRNLDALTGAGKSALAIGDANAAISFFARAEEISPKDGRIKSGLASALVQVEQPKTALKLFGEAVTLGVPEGEIAGDRGLAYDLQGDNRRAQADYLQALRWRPDDETTRRLAVSQAISGDRQAAMATLDALLRRQDRAAWRVRAFVLALTGDRSGAEEAALAVMPRGQAEALMPYFGRLAALRPGEKAAAVHLGQFPSDSRSSSGSQAVYANASPAAVPPPVGGPRSDVPLIPAGNALGSTQPVTRAPDTRAPRRRPGATGLAGLASANPVSAWTAAPQALPAADRPALPFGQGSGAIVSASPQPAQLRPSDASTAAAGSFAPAGQAVPPTAVQTRSAYPGGAPQPPSVATAPAVQAPAAPPPVVAAATPQAPVPAVATSAPSTNATAASAPGFSADPLGGAAAAPSAGTEPRSVFGPPVPTELATASPPAGVTGLTASTPMVRAIDLPGSAAAGSAPTPAPVQAAVVPMPPPRPKAADPVKAEATTGSRQVRLISPAAKLAASEPKPAAPKATSKGKEEPAEKARSSDRPVKLAAADPRDARSRMAVTKAEKDTLKVKDRTDKASVDAKDTKSKGTSSKDKDVGTKADVAKDDKGRDAKAKAAAAKEATAKDAKSKDAKSKTAATREAAVDKAGKTDKSSKAPAGERYWVQVASGSNRADLGRAWERTKAKAPKLLGGRATYTAPWKQSNRLLVGPFKSEDEAQGFVNSLAKAGTGGIQFTSRSGTKVEPLGNE